MTATPTKATHGRVEALDLLRLFAALAVVLYHYSFRGAGADGMTWLSLPEIVPVTKYGFLGVQLFFVISGFVIAYSAEGRTMREFIVARGARIYPGFAVCMTLTFAVLAMIGAPRFQVTLTQWLANLAIVSPAANQPFMDGVYWSIVYELVFYVWIALIIASGAFSRWLPAIVAGWLLLSAGNELLLASGAVRRLFLTDDSGFFAAGVMLYAIHSGRRTPLTWGLLTAATVFAGLQGDWGADWVRDHFQIALSYGVVVGLCIAAVLVVGGCLLLRHLPVPGAVLLAIGGLTYPLYLTHQMIGFAVFNRLEGVGPNWALAAGTITAMLALSWAIYRYVERPGQKLVRQILSRILRLPARGAPAREISETAASAAGVPVFGPVALPRAARVAVVR